MKFLGIIALWACLAGSAWASTTPAPEQLFRQGLKLYEQGNFADGVALFENASTNLPPESTLDPARIYYNIGVGRYRLSQPEEAGKAFQSALRTTDVELQGRAYFNLANTQCTLAKKALDEGDIVTALTGYQAAQTNYMHALRIHSTDRDAKINYELSVVAQYRIMEMVAMALARLQQGEQLVDAYRFIDAARWFQEQKPLMEKALELEPEKKKAYQTMVERTTGVAGILAPPEEGAAP